MHANGTLFLVATPIGNLADITLRALDILRAADILACEDTRHTRKLLAHYGINARTVSYHEHNEHTRAAELVEALLSGKTIALVSDAGTPAISDPGFRLVQLCVERGVRVETLPGAAAFVCALAASGLPTDAFYFGGFLPVRSMARRGALEKLNALAATLIFYEAPHRIAAALQDALEMLGNRRAVVARELTKLHEEYARGTLAELVELFTTGDKARGEMVLLIDRAQIGASDKDVNEDAQTKPSLAARVGELEATGLAPRAALKQAARELGLTRDAAYRELVRQKGK